MAGKEGAQSMLLVDKDTLESSFKPCQVRVNSITEKITALPVTLPDTHVDVLDALTKDVVDNYYCQFVAVQPVESVYDRLIQTLGF